MTIEPGQKLLHYRLVEKIGQGGMGMVWRAVDTTLERDVAIKILPDEFARDPERLARFEREARLLASLNHPNVAAIYGIHPSTASTGSGQADPGQVPDGAIRAPFLAMEFVEGEDLAQRLTRGAVPVEDALRIALEISRGFEAAHTRGIVHRDLKPANVKLARDGSVKVLDVGLAKALAPEERIESSMPSMSPTLTSAGTVAGMILGTASYMSPEQAKGKPVDRRADIWSFGVVLFEMLCGRRLFEGETVSETMAAVLLKDPDWSALPAGTPAKVRRLLQRCLTRDPANRLQDIGDARIVLQEVLSGGAGALETDDAATEAARAAARAASAAAAARNRRLLAGSAVAVLLAFAAGWFAASRGTAEDGSTSDDAVMRFSVSVAPGLAAVWNPVADPQDRYLVYQGIGADHEDALYVHDFETGEARPLPGTHAAWSPFLSPDGRWIGFHRGPELMKIRRSGGDAVKIADVATDFPGAAWGPDDTILVPLGWLQPLYQVSAEGELRQVSTLDVEAGEKGHWWPRFLPGGRHALFTTWKSGAGLIDSDVAVLDLETGKHRTLFRGAGAWFLPPGHIVFYRAGVYHAIAFDPDALATSGDPVPVLEDASDPAPGGNESLGLALSDRGTLYYNTRQGTPATRFAIVEPDREARMPPFAPREYQAASLSPDGRSIAATSLESGVLVIRLLDLETGTDERMQMDGSSFDPSWKPDGSGFAFVSMRKGDYDVYFKDLRTGEPAQPVRTTPTDEMVKGWSRDSGRMLVLETQPDGSYVLSAFAVDGADDPIGIAKDVDAAAISPDGRWMSYTAGTGADEVYVRPYPGPGADVRISPRRGRQPAWSPDGSELYYIRERAIVAVRCTVVGDRIRPGEEEVLFESPSLRSTSSGPLMVLGPRRFVVSLLEEAPGPPELKVVLNWRRDVLARLAAE